VLYLIFSDSTNFFPAVYFETIFFRGEKMFGDCMNLTGIIAPRRADLQGGLLLYLGWLGLYVDRPYSGDSVLRRAECDSGGRTVFSVRPGGSERRMEGSLISSSHLGRLGPYKKKTEPIKAVALRYLLFSV
jgi:hypothetical protein